MLRSRGVSGASLLATLAVLTGAVSAQRQFEELAKRHLPLDCDRTYAMALGDVDGDGDQDVIFGNGGQSRLYLNVLRHLDAPFLARAGFDYRLDVYARHGPPRPTDVAGLFLSTGTANIPLPPFGTFGLDPSRLLALPPFVIPQPEGVSSVSFLVPDVPGVAGVTLYAQALIVQQPVAHLTNVTGDTVLR